MTLFIYLFTFLFPWISNPDKGTLKVNLPSDYVYVPSGTYLRGYKATDRIDISGFYISKVEVTCLAFREFLANYKPKSTTDLNLLIDSSHFSNEEKILARVYYTHPAYESYPVTGVTYTGAQKYCEWLKEKLQNHVGKDFNVEVRLPSSYEWEWAASAANGLDKYFGFNGYYSRNAEGKLLANYSSCETSSEDIPDLLMKIPSNDHNCTSRVNSFLPNDLGIYNMSGNVEELVQEPGITKGGSYKDPLKYLYSVTQKSINTNDSQMSVGFRPIVIITANGTSR
ncbi:MAG: SUMF1/EgtB/PvdO family nonheme iron enzyme [Saprospiraceae bacterium]|nr:SUMF1/EgtB/PvdO family nonheme iron enzyme [Saprospiraceae bacterium]